MVLAPVIQPACIVLRVHLEGEVKEATVRWEQSWSHSRQVIFLIPLPYGPSPMAHGVHNSEARKIFW